MMIEMKKNKCFNRIKCVKPKMDLERRNGNQANIKVLVGSNLKMMKTQAKTKVLTMTKIAMKKVSNKKRRTMMNKAIITFDYGQSLIFT